MDNRRKSLPPLDTLVFFDSVLRAGSFSAAASELYVSQAAVSKRVRQLEDWLGVDLFERGPRSLELTQAGAQLADPIAMTLDYLQGVLNRVRGPASPSACIAANSAVSVFWLFKRLKSFALSPASCPIKIVNTDDPRELESAENDMAIIYADQVPKGWSGQLLMEEELAPVSSPEGAKRFADDPLSMCLLNYQRHAPDWINWQIWEQRVQRNPFHGLQKEMCQSYSHTIGQALAGNGIALASCSLLEDELASGRLTILVDKTMKTGKGYFLIWQQQSEIRQEITDLIRHLNAS